MTQQSHDDPLAAQLISQAALITKLRRDLDAIASEATDAVADLLARMEQLEADGSPSSGADSPTAWCWRDLGPRAHDELWSQLLEWVTWLRSRYPLARKVPACWAEHPELVEELTALWLAWQAAYQIRDASLTAAIDWHDRWLPGLLHRLEHGPSRSTAPPGTACGPQVPTPTPATTRTEVMANICSDIAHVRTRLISQIRPIRAIARPGGRSQPWAA